VPSGSRRGGTKKKEPTPGQEDQRELKSLISKIKRGSRSKFDEMGGDEILHSEDEDEQVNVDEIDMA
jgi:hypothetical protein